MVDVAIVPVELMIPSESLRIVAMQPYLHLRPNSDPFQWDGSARDAQMTAIQKTLDIASSQPNCAPATFTLFPEYSIPGVDVAAEITQHLFSSAWLSNTVVIGGLEGLTHAQYTTLIKQLGAYVAPCNSPEHVADHLWINCCLVWVKDSSGILRTWAQPKIRPAYAEEAVPITDMFCGGAIYVFRARYDLDQYPFAFMTLICSDWFKQRSGKNVWEEVCSELNSLWSKAPADLDWVFVIQCEPKPSHPSILGSTKRFLSSRSSYVHVRRDKAGVLHVNTAASELPAAGGLGGQTACVFAGDAPLDVSSPAAPPTVCIHPKKLRGHTVLAPCKDLVFREAGACIHSFSIRVARFASPVQEDHTSPIHEATVHAMGKSDDPRLAGLPVSASVKWLNDNLDDLPSITATDLTLTCSLASEAQRVESGVISDLRTASEDAATRCMNLCVASLRLGKSCDKDYRANPDKWGSTETQCIEHVSFVLTALRLVYDVNVRSSHMHGTIARADALIQVVAVRGERHEDWLRHIHDFVDLSDPDPILVVVRDRNNTCPTEEELRKYYDVKPDPGIAFLPYCSLIEKCRVASDKDTLGAIINEYLPGERRII